MSSNFKTYQKAAERLNSGWVWNAWQGNKGEVCLVQSVLVNLDRKYSVNRVLPEEVVNELATSMSKHLEFRMWVRLFRAVAVFQPERFARIAENLQMGTSSRVLPEQVAMIAWNDAIWRTKDQVVHAMQEVAYDSELVWQRARVVELEAELMELRKKMTLLEVKVIELTKRNESLLQRLTSKVMLVGSTRELQGISDNLDKVLAEHQQLTGATAK